MMNLSLARIMYGTNEDLHTWGSMNAPAVSSLTMSSEGHSAVQNTSLAPGSLSRLLHKAWAALHRKT